MYKLFKFIILCLVTVVFSIDMYGQIFEEMTDVSGLRSSGMNFGVAISDMNADGMADIYISRRGEPNLLYINKGDFRFEEQAGKLGIADDANTQTAIWIDFDNDKDLDLFLADNKASNKMYRNDLGSFTDVTTELGLTKTGPVKSAIAADYDNDGDLDLYLSYFLKQNVLYRNEEGQRFIDITATAGIDDIGPSMAAIFFDYDNDGDQDLYQTHDGNKANILYKNEGGYFTDVSAICGCDYAGQGMGVDAADVNNDGYLDLYITNLKENTLLINNEDGNFYDIATIAKVDDIGMGWGTFIFDSNNNGHEDIYVANESLFGVNGFKNLKNILYINRGNLVFDHSEEAGGIQNEFSSYGAAYADFDNDGRLDFVVANIGDAGQQIFHNISDAGNYVALHLVGTESNYQAIGARANLYADGQKFVREVKLGSGWVSQSSTDLHFGLSEIAEVDSITISWPSGKTQVLTDVDINENHNVVEPSEFLSGPLIWTVPTFPTQNDDITVYFDATEGNSGLANYEGAVYAHAGVITSASNSPSDWKHVQGTWGVDFPKTKMNSEGNNIYSLAYNIEEFYGIDNGELVEQLAFVFRNVDGSITGRDIGGGDIFIDVYPPEDGLFVIISSPSEAGEFLNKEDTLTIIASINQKAKLDLYDNSELIYSDSLMELNYKYTSTGFGLRDLNFVFSLDGDTINEHREIYVLDNDFEQIDGPDSISNGLNYYSDSSLIFKLYAPNKEQVFYLTYENNFTPARAFRMRQSLDRSYFWIEVSKSIFIDGETNAYTYLVDRDLIADPYSTVVLDPSNDPWVPDDVMAELPAYPDDRLSGVQITVFDVEKSDYPWTDEDYDREDQSNLVIYELLMRDFLSDRNYKSLKDTLDYLEKLGVTAIELMPVNEFESNGSWGYNPSFHMAVDKEYGSKDQLKAVIDEAHKRGIAVILDVVYNHVFSQSPLARLYWDDSNFRPTSENPYLNVTPKHPFNVGYDVNHESTATKEWVKQTLQYWMEEFHFDGFRFDLSKGFTQKSSSGDDVFRQYDAGRIATLKDYADFVWNIDDQTYVILEHFAANDEETELANYGMMLWGNMNHQFIEAARGKSSDLEWVDYTVRGWEDPHVVGYMESHDEERMMVRVLDSGAKDGDYDTRDPEIALRRVAAASTIFYSVPGPKMLWQFGELGYDYSINWCTNGTVNGCRLDPKPVKWDYLEDENRKELNSIISNVLHLKKNYPTFSARDFTFSDGNFYLKTVHLNHEEMDAVVMANFRVTNSDINPKFQNQGTWYEYFTGDSLIVENTQEKITHLPGEYRIYTSKRITPPSGFVTSVKDIYTIEGDIFPNPVTNEENVHLVSKDLEPVRSVRIIDNLGQSFLLPHTQFGSELNIELPNEMEVGLYHIAISTKSGLVTRKLIKL